MDLTEDTAVAPRFTRCVRSLMLASLEGASLGFAIGASAVSARLLPYVATNRNTQGIRQAIIASTLTYAFLLPVLILATCALPHAAGKRLSSLETRTRILSPLCTVGFVPLLFQPELWKDKTLGFLITTGLFSTVVTLSIGTSWRAASGLSGSRWLRDLAAMLRVLQLRIAPKTSLVLSVAAVSLLALYGLVTTFSATKAPVPGSVAEWALITKFSGYNNFGLWFTGIGTHATGHVSVLGALCTVWTWLWPRPDSLLWLRLLAITWPAFPLLLWTRRSVGVLAAPFIAIAYLSLPLRAMLAANDTFPALYSLGFFFLAGYYFDSKRIGNGLVAALLAIALHEQAAIWFVTLGVFFATRQRALTWGTWLALAALLYFSYAALVLLPEAGVTTYSGNATLVAHAPRALNPQPTSQAQSLLNVAYVVPHWLDNQNLEFWFLLLLPLGLLPLRNSRWFVCLLPGILWSFLSRSTLDWHTSGYALFFALVLVSAIISVTNLKRSDGSHGSRYAAVYAGWLAALLPCIVMFGTLWLPAQQ